MKLIVENISPSAYYDGRVINYRVHATTAGGLRFCCLDPSGSAACLRSGDRVDGLLTALHYKPVPERFGENCVSGIVRRTLPQTMLPAYRDLLDNHFIGLETGDGLLFLFYDESKEKEQPLNDGQIITVRITGGLYLELLLSGQYAV